MAHQHRGQRPLPIGDSFKLNYNDIEDFRNDLRGKRRHRTRISKWIDTERYWKDRLGSGWKGKKFLGKGGFGIVGHWRYEGSDRNQRVKDIAVKQVFNKSLENEVVFLKRLAEVGTPHIVKMYGKLINDAVFATDDVKAGDVQRLYLEFCPGGDLHNYLQEFIRR